MLKYVYFFYTLAFFLISFYYYATLVNPMVENNITIMESLNQITWMGYLFIFQVIFLALGLVIFSVGMWKSFLKNFRHLLIFFTKFFVFVGIIGLFISGATQVEQTSNVSKQFETLYWMFFVWIILFFMQFGSIKRFIKY